MQKSMNTVRFTVSLPPDLAIFIEQYQKNHAIQNRSQVIASSLRAFQEAELAAAYRAHALEWQTDPDKDFWDAADNLEEA